MSILLRAATTAGDKSVDFLYGLVNRSEGRAGVGLGLGTNHQLVFF